MKLSDAVQLAYQRQWSMNNTFNVSIELSEYLTKEVGSFGDDVNLDIISIQTPDFQNDPIEVFSANRWFIHNGKDAVYTFTISFRDHDQMTLYRKFSKIYKLTRYNYFKDVSFKIIISKDADWYDEEDKILFSLDGVIMSGLSNLDLNNTNEKQITEFSVTFKCVDAQIISN